MEQPKLASRLLSMNAGSPGGRAMFFRTIQWRLIFILFLITFVLMTVIWVFMTYRVERSFFYETFQGQIARNYDSLGILETDTAAKLRERLSTDPVITGLISGEDKSFTMIDKEKGVILYSSDPVYQDAELQDQFLPAIIRSVNLISVMEGKSEGINPTHTRTRIAGLGDFYDYVRYQPLQDQNVILFFKYSREQALNVLNDFNGMILFSIVIALVAALGIGLAMSRTITRPITDIMHKAESITAGEFGQLLEVRSMDEIGKLTSTFNFMSTRLKSMLTEIAAEKSKVETVINHMTDGVLAFDRNGLAIHVNHSAASLLGPLTERRSPSGGTRGNRLSVKRERFSDKPLRFDELMPALGIATTLAFFLRPEDVLPKPVTVPLADRFLRLQFATFSDEEGRRGGVIIVLQDITEEHRLENMRREFVANVSHELRTPLTSVKSYTETLLDGAMEDRETTVRFLKVINDETDRMVRLVKDLLLLSQHDSGMKLTLSPVDPEELVRVCLERLRHAADEKNQCLTMQRADDLPSPLIVQGDRDRLEQLFLNIVGNAVKYTPAGGTVRVELALRNSQLAILVHDTGIGIPEQDLERIFERFYRVDKARSRQMGGTGLGLAIAKEIAMMHGGDIRAQSRMNEGSVITITLPLSPSGDQASG